ncbi:uncharacterized protein [Lepeophtheirus salmonis]|uniref:uncharacterized protein n=1 Tax=Lepeophtheirus salmonis TaxID=72036 RepID=UPI001AE31CE9|nr:DNA-directed RNA polymerase II subunit RPB1-like [Lepeophtheirus salmonis]
MKYLIVLTATLVAASASFIGHPGYPYAPQPYHQVAPYYAPYTPSSQHHSQDEYGNFAYGYENVNSQKSESGNAYGAVKGQYSYIDAYGKSQTVDYVADDYGFRASGTNLVNSADALNTGYRHKRSAIYPYAPTLAYSVVATHPTALYHHAAPAAVAHHGPAAIHASPVAAHHGPAPAAHTAIASSQYRTQDEYDNFSFGYANENSQRQESGNGYGGVSGSYSYVDAYGKPHTVNYVADDLGFRATGTDLVNSAYADKAYRKKRSIGYPAYPSYAPHAYAPVARAYAPHPIASIPAYHAPAVASSQYHSQDEYDNYNYGYQNINSQKSESGNARDVVKGSYSYIDSYGKSQTVNYVADGYGFRASGTNLVNSADALNTY